MAARCFWTKSAICRSSYRPDCCGYFRMARSTGLAVPNRCVSMCGLAATHQPLEERVQQGKFREDLFHRLNVIRLRLPPLRERREDIPELARHFLAASARSLGVPAKRLSGPAVAALAQFDFPGNVRQLENFCHWLTVMAPGQTVGVSDLPPEIRTADIGSLAGRAATDATAGSAATWQQLLALDANVRLTRTEPQVWDTLTRQFERTLLQSSLDVCRGRRVEAAADSDWGATRLRVSCANWEWIR